MDIEDLPVSDRWKKKFALIEKSKSEKLSFKESLSANFNIWAFLFGPFAYFGKGLYQKGFFIFGFHFLWTSILLYLETLIGEEINSSVYSCFNAVYGGLLNNDYYKKVVHGETFWPSIPIIKSKFQVAVFFLSTTGVIVYQIFITPIESGDYIKVGDKENLMYYGEGIDTTELNQFANILEEEFFMFFEYSTYLKLNQIDSGYKLMFPYEKRSWDYPDIIIYFERLQYKLMTEFEDKKIVIELYDGTFKRNESILVGCDIKEKCISYQFEKWQIKPQKRREKVELMERNLAEVNYYIELFESTIKNNEDELSFEENPHAFRFASNGIALPNINDVPKYWLDCFIDKDEAKMALSIFEESFYGFKWPDFDSIFKSHLFCLKKIKQNLLKKVEEEKRV